ncbi:3-hydroxyacyl-CoA dehydrogenase NAD-binding domain-containing protein [Variovorax sp. GB1R11]|uniref:3-hydroxyacyl-CoA dehydrogenase NAD-binding domain-containing protein n=1 Tax=Variovorax sp. GB1R11 TaxID=3443741 RepID=UPI003F44B696
MTAITFDKDGTGVVTLTIDMPGQATNTMNGVFRQALGGAVERLEAEREGIAGVILTSGKKTFFAGGDLNDLLAVGPDDGQAVFDRAMAMKAMMRRLEKLGRPVVAALNGTALGGGFELALACHARFALDDPKLDLGLPEVGLGLLPGGGGVVRMVRHLGLEKAMPFLLEGTLFSPAKAQALGLVDGVAGDIPALLTLAREWIATHADATQPWDRKGYRLPGATASAPAPLAWLKTAPVTLIRKYKGCYPAPEAIFSAAVEGTSVDFDTALRVETRHFVGLVTGQVAKNLITTFFFQINEVKSGKGRPEGVPHASFSKVGILGAGMMGAGIAHACASRGVACVLKDTTAEKAELGKAYSEKVFSKRVAKGAMSEERMQAALQRIAPTADAADLAGCDLVIEAVFENREVKAQVVREASPHLAPGGIMASNTSTLPITGLATAYEQQENFIGLHFFSPVDRMPLVEIIKGRRTSDDTLARAYDFVKQIGKTPIVVNDSRGFYTSRVFGTFTREGAAMLAEGIDAATIENAALQAGMPVGPLAVMDEVAMSLTLSVRRQATTDLAAEGKPLPQHPAWAVLEKMVDELGRPGRAGGGGFYDYPAGEPKTLWADLTKHFPPCGNAAPFDDLKERFLFAQAIEAVRCIEEGVLASARDANIGSILGVGYPRWTGGTVQYINGYGLPRFVDRATMLAERYGSRFAPPPLLQRKAAAGERFD